MNRKVLLAGAIVVLPLIAILVLNIGRDPHAVDSPLLGKPAPDFTLAPVDGGPPLALSSLRGRTVVVNFFATWCGPCIEEHPTLTAAAAEMGKDVAFVSIVYQDEPAAVAAFKQKHGLPYPALADPESRTAIAFGVTGVPETFFVDAQGRIATKYVGPITSRKALLTLLQKAQVGP